MKCFYSYKVSDFSLSEFPEEIICKQKDEGPGVCDPPTGRTSETAKVFAAQNHYWR